MRARYEATEKAQAAGDLAQAEIEYKKFVSDALRRLASLPVDLRHRGRRRREEEIAVRIGKNGEAIEYLAKGSDLLELLVL
jgi:hypothetical protein